MTVVDLVAEFTTAIRSQATSTAYGRGQLLTLPWALADGESVTLYVEEIGDSLFHVSDRGLAADALALAGVDLSHKGAAASWAAVRRSMVVAPSIMREVGDYELSGSASIGELGQALTTVGEAVLRADGLRALSTHRPQLTFPDRVIRHAADRSLAVEPRAALPTRFGSRRTVTCRVEGASWAYVQALSAGTRFNEAYDHARSIFGDASKELRSHLVAVVADGARPESWQIRSLEEHSRVVRESEQDDFFASLAA